MPVSPHEPKMASATIVMMHFVPLRHCVFFMFTLLKLTVGVLLIYFYGDRIIEQDVFNFDRLKHLQSFLSLALYIYQQRPLIFLHGTPG